MQYRINISRRNWGSLECITFGIAIFITVATCAAILFIIGVIANDQSYFGTELQSLQNMDEETARQTIMDRKMTYIDFFGRYIISLVIMTLLTVNLVFCILLCDGLYKVKVGQIRAYIIYGAVKEILGLIAGIIFCVCNEIILGPVLILFCVLYATILYMIEMTIRKFKSSPQFFELNEDKIVVDTKLKPNEKM